ncbi:hypothetical protein CEXT_33971 [Caerostris extrusa]|uniref:Uncharacterized protein n=1 Tax=Caerostris extrusa TaxID=172846 RepID=A0AAV4XPC3_CAEEX|nr:hypothetical protein CEXT_33971 [Caerostris extrusa]
MYCSGFFLMSYTVSLGKTNWNVPGCRDNRQNRRTAPRGLGGMEWKAQHINSDERLALEGIRDCDCDGAFAIQVQHWDRCNALQLICKVYCHVTERQNIR